MTNAEHQRAYRQRQANKQGRMKAALETIQAELADSTGEKGKRLHALATAALTAQE